MTALPRVVVLGGGFGGLRVVRALAGAPVEITLVDRRNFHLFQPLLYQVATGGLSPANIAAPLRSLFARQRNVTVLLAEAVDLDPESRRVILTDGALPYDTLVVATGVRHDYFGHDEFEPWAPGLKTIEEATEIRRRILLAFEKAEREEDAARREAWLTFAVVGGGPTGVELAGTLGEIARHTLEHDFRRIDPASARIFLFEGADRVLPSFPPSLSAKAERALAGLGVTVKVGTRVLRIQEESVTLGRAGAPENVPPEILTTRTVLWAAGVKASPLGAILARTLGAELDRAGRVKVGPDLSVPAHPEVFVIGDLASVLGEGGKPLPGVAQPAMQAGSYVGRVIRKRLRGEAAPPFRYRDLGNMATIGRAAAVADLGWLRLSGYGAWLIWLFIHLAYLIQFGNRLLVLTQWAWNYVTWNRSARLITGENVSPATPRR